MQYIYFGSVFMAAMAHLIMAVPLFLQRREGERSRSILAFFVLVSVFNYTLRITSVLEGEIPSLVVSVPMLLVAIFMVTCYILYPIEVISPGWLNFKRTLGIYSPLLLFTVIWLISRLFGVYYYPYGSLLEMLPDIADFNAGYRIFLCVMLFMPLLFIFFIPYTKKYSNTDKQWVWGYVGAFTVNTLGYLAVLAYDSIYIDTAYYYITVFCELFIVYNELFVRIIAKPESEISSTFVLQPHSEEINKETKNIELFNKLDAYMHEDQRWRDPDLSMSTLVSDLHTNRTTLSLSIQEQGYENYADYINQLRINEFITLMTSGKSKNFMESFFDVGFRSKSAAFRNFRKVTNKTPTEYFKSV